MLSYQPMLYDTLTMVECGVAIETRHQVRHCLETGIRELAANQVSGKSRKTQAVGSASPLELPVFIDRLDGPVELFPERLGEEALNRNIELLGEDDG
jgi:hypothetical protein